MAVPAEIIPRYRNLFRRLANNDPNVQIKKLEHSARLARMVRAAGVEAPLLSARATRQYRLLLTRDGEDVHLHGFRYRGDPESYK